MANQQPRNTLTADPRALQIAALGTLLTAGIAMGYLQLGAAIAATIIVSALLAEWCGTRNRFEPRSALISALSLCLLLRTNDPIVAATAATLAIASKSVFRFDGRHVFNPTAFAIVVMTSVCDGAWISPGQWGHTMLLGIAIAGAGCLVVVRAARIDTTLAFLAGFAGLAVMRGVYLGDPFAVTLHQLSNGALLIFAFFMISDPRSTPLGRGPRIAFALLVACVAAWIEFALFRPNGAIVALVICAPCVPIANRLWPARVPEPVRTRTPVRSKTCLQGEHHVCP